MITLHSAYTEGVIFLEGLVVCLESYARMLISYKPTVRSLEYHYKQTDRAQTSIRGGRCFEY